MYRLCTLLIAVLVSTTSFAVTLVHNVQGYTLDNNGKLQAFTTLVYDAGKVIAIGDDALIAEYADAKKVDGKGNTLLPGLIDAHGHLLGLGANLLQVDIRDMSSADAAAQKVFAYAQANPDLAWLTGRGWNQVLWPGKAFPTAQQLDEYVNDRPVWLERVDGHAGWANSKALELAGITKDTIDPPGGKIIRDANGNPSGVLIDNAMYMLDKLLPKASEAVYAEQLDAAGKHLLSLGITSMHDAGISRGVYDFYQARAKAGTLPLRVYAMIAATDPELMTMLEAGYVETDDDMLSIRSVKAYGDGALGSRGAALLEPYSDAPDNTGLLVTQENQLQPLFDAVLGSKFQLNFHAIGDRANRLALDQFELTMNRIGARDQRHRIEHAQVIEISDLPRFAELDVIPSMQPTHATSDMNMAEDRVGPARLQGAYAWQKLIKSGARIAFGSDFPVELANPFYGLHAAVTRQDRNNQPKAGWIPEEAVTLEQALKGFTLDAAYSAHQDKVLGTLTPGKWADFILIDRDIVAGDKKDIWRPEVHATYIAGEKVYQR